MSLNPHVLADKRRGGREAREATGRRVYPGVVAGFVEGSLGVNDDVAAIAKEAGGAGEELDRRGSSAVLGCLGSLR